MSDSADDCSASFADDYSTSFAVACVFVVLATSLIGIVIPILGNYYPKLMINPFVYTVGKHFGTGVLFSLALIHLLVPAIETLTNPCLPYIWSEKYSFAAVFAIIAAFAMHAIETTIQDWSTNRIQNQARQQSSSNQPLSADVQSPPDSNFNLQHNHTHNQDDHDHHPHKHIDADVIAEEQPHYHHNNAMSKDSTHIDMPSAIIVPSMDKSNDTNHKHNHNKKQISIPPQHYIPADSIDGLPSKPVKCVEDDPHFHIHSLLIETNAERSIGVYILEAGLACHSVIIGLTLGTSGSHDLKTLLPALVFHQFFEGFALGARLATADFPILMQMALAFFYSVSAPFGIAIGIGIRHSYNANATKALLSQGILDSLSAGILLYVALVQMLGHEFHKDYNQTSNNSSSTKMTLAKKAILFAAMYAGAAILAVIGLWL